MESIMSAGFSWQRSLDKYLPSLLFQAKKNASFAFGEVQGSSTSGSFQNFSPFPWF
jgi:hypothetical protein